MPEENDIHNAEELHFYYDRKSRIDRAPELVRSHYDGSEKLPPKGFFKVLVHTKTSRFLLGSIVLLVIMILFVTNISIDKSSDTFHSIDFELSAFAFEETVFVTLKALTSPVENDVPVTVYFESINSTGAVIESSSVHSIFDGNENFYRTTFSKYDIITIHCSIVINDEILELTTKVQE